MMENCKFCKKYNEETDECQVCQYDIDEAKLFAKDDWDILNLDDDVEWSHIQILNRLHQKGVDCTFCDIWTNSDIAFLVGCNERDFRIARALNIHEEVIYNDFDHCFVILNLFQEKYLRGWFK